MPQVRPAAQQLHVTAGFTHDITLEMPWLSDPESTWPEIAYVGVLIGTEPMPARYKPVRQREGIVWWKPSLGNFWWIDAGGWYPAPVLVTQKDGQIFFPPPITITSVYCEIGFGLEANLQVYGWPQPAP